MGFSKGARCHYLTNADTKKPGLFFEDFDTQSAFGFYESVRLRLPSAEFAPTAQYAMDLLAISDLFDVFVFDAFGVLNVGDRAIAGAVNCIATLRERGKRVFIITNAATLTKPNTVAKFEKLGFDFLDAEIFTSRMAAENALAVRGISLWGVGSKADFNPGDLAVGSVLLTDDPDAYDRVGGFLLLSTWEWTSRQQHLLEASLGKNNRPVIVANPDVIAPQEHGFSTEPGYIGHRLANLLGIEIEFHGKPFPSVFDLLQKSLPTDIDRKRICMIGDTLHTDVLGGASMGWSTILVSDHGLFRGHDPQAFIAQSGIVPDWIIPSI